MPAPRSTLFPPRARATLRSISFFFNVRGGSHVGSARAADPPSERPKERTKEERADVEGLGRVLEVAAPAFAVAFSLRRRLPLSRRRGLVVKHKARVVVRLPSLLLLLLFVSVHARLGSKVEPLFVAGPAAAGTAADRRRRPPLGEVERLQRRPLPRLPLPDAGLLRRLRGRSRSRRSASCSRQAAAAAVASSALLAALEAELGRGGLEVDGRAAAVESSFFFFFLFLFLFFLPPPPPPLLLLLLLPQRQRGSRVLLSAAVFACRRGPGGPLCGVRELLEGGVEAREVSVVTVAVAVARRFALYACANASVVAVSRLST